AAPTTPHSPTLSNTTPPRSTAPSPSATLSRSLTIGYSASDGGSGLAQVDVYAKAPGQSSYTKVASDTSPGASGSFSYTAAAGDGSDSFYTGATDAAGNTEAAPNSPDETTLVVS